MRERIVLGTKGCQQVGAGVNDRGASRYHLMNALDASLRRLRTDHVDLYQIHIFDPDTPIEETCAPWTRWCARAKCGCRLVPIYGLADRSLQRPSESYGWTPLVPRRRNITC